MEFEINFSNLKSKLVVSKWVWIFIAGLMVGAVFAVTITDIYSAKTIITMNGECLTTTDLNRSDMSAVIVLSRFCEGMGLQSSVIWQQDYNGNIYGLPICLQK